MNVKENYLLYLTAYELVSDQGYELLHINDQIKEIWLQKDENKTSKVLRLTTQEFNWKNHLKKDIAQVFQKTLALKRYLPRKTVEVNNIYITKHAPVDDWETLKKPMMLKEKKNPVRMNVYYLYEEGFQEEEERLEANLHFSLPNEDIEESEDILEEKTNHYKRELSQFIANKKKERENVFSFGKPRLIYLLLLVNVLMYFLLEFNGGSDSIDTLIKYGAKYNPAILMDGEWWRIVSSMFLHIGLLHLIMNMIAVFYLGTLVERIYGSFRFFIIYMLAGIGGGVASFAFSMNVSAGASGALFGLFGALLFFGLIYKRLFFQTIGMNLLILIGINIVFGFTVPAIDNAAHIGGLITGFIAAAIVHLPRKEALLKQGLAFVLYIILITALVIFGIQNNANDPTYQLSRIDQLLEEDNYEQVVEDATAALENPSALEAPLLFQRSYAYIELDQLDLAITDLEKSIQLTDEEPLPESFYNLALLYYETGEEAKAEEAIKEAYQLKPDDENYLELYENIIGEKPTE